MVQDPFLTLSKRGPYFSKSQWVDSELQLKVIHPFFIFKTLTSLTIFGIIYFYKLTTRTLTSKYYVTTCRWDGCVFSFEVLTHKYDVPSINATFMRLSSLCRKNNSEYIDDKISIVFRCVLPKLSPCSFL